MTIGWILSTSEQHTVSWIAMIHFLHTNHEVFILKMYYFITQLTDWLIVDGK